MVCKPRRAHEAGERRAPVSPERRLMRAAIALCAVMCCVSVFCLTAMASAASWSTQPPTSSLPLGALDGIACRGSTFCIAVGSLGNQAGAARWNGAAWSVLRTPNLADASRSGLSGVACSSRTSCTAVGTRLTKRRTIALIERWRGSRWIVQQTPRPAGPRSSSLSAVSCASGKYCVAVGDYVNRTGLDVPMVELWNGLSWSVQPAPYPPDVHGQRPAQSRLLGVSCMSRRWCMAVGQSGEALDYGSQTVPFAERWNGRSWVLVSAPDPVTGALNSLDAISCTSSNVCVAVGSAQPSVDAGQSYTLAEGWNGIKWSIQRRPAPPYVDSWLNSVSCSSKSHCTAVGAKLNSSGGDAPLAESWNGSQWTAQPIAPSAASAQADLFGVSCLGGVSCLAIGQQYENSTSYFPLTAQYS
jgi:hypothetical protein